MVQRAVHTIKRHMKARNDSRKNRSATAMLGLTWKPTSERDIIQNQKPSSDCNLYSPDYASDGVHLVKDVQNIIPLNYHLGQKKRFLVQVQLLQYWLMDRSDFTL